METGSKQQQALLRRFAAACENDSLVAAAFLGGSLAAGTADEQSDLDIYLVTNDDDYDAFFDRRHDFMRRLGEPIFLEDFNDFGFDMLLFTFTNGLEGELALARESHFRHIHGGAYRVLVDKRGLLDGKVFPLLRPAEEEQHRKLRKLIYWFWESLSYFIIAMHRGQLWTAYISQNEMRVRCMNLMRMRRDFTLEAEGYWKVELALSEEELQPLKETFCSLEEDAMLQAVSRLVGAYRQIAPDLAAKHGIDYPRDLDRVISKRFATLITSKKSRR